MKPIDGVDATRESEAVFAPESDEGHLSGMFVWNQPGSDELVFRGRFLAPSASSSAKAMTPDSSILFCLHEFQALSVARTWKRSRIQINKRRK
jgi:hypothetical protein